MTPMRRALQLASQARGHSSPNPPVGAVLVRDGKTVGEGRTQPPGQAHAEIMALRAAGERARGATLFVTLEPCSHWGRTPPCADALIEAGIAKAHVAVLDPNPIVHGQGVVRLRDAGIEVVVGEDARAAAEMIEAHTTFTTQHRPFVVLELLPPMATDCGVDAWMLYQPPDVVVYRPGEHLPRRIPIGEPIHAILSGLARSDITSLAVTETDELTHRLLKAGLVDKVVTQVGVTPPAGFDSGELREHPAPHMVYYPKSRE